MISKGGMYRIAIYPSLFIFSASFAWLFGGGVSASALVLGLACILIPIVLIADDVQRGIWDEDRRRLALVKNRFDMRYGGLAGAVRGINWAAVLKCSMCIMLFFNLCLLGSYLDDDPDSFWFSTNALLRMSVLLAPLFFIAGTPWRNDEDSTS